MTQSGISKKGILPVLDEEIDDFEKEVEKYIRGDWDPESFIRFRLRQGVYGQRQPDVQMIRVKVPGGGLTADQLDALGVIARDYSPMKKGHVTTRENMQFHFIPLVRTPDAMRVIGNVGLTSREACGNTVRNVTGCPFAGVCADEPFDVTPYAGAFARYFLRHPLTQVMPRKFKTTFSGCESDCALSAIHDLGFIPRVREIDGEEKRGFQIMTGGGLSIMPRIGYTLYEFVPAEDLLRVSEAVIRIFEASDELRKNKMKARIKFLIDRVGIDEFRNMVDAELKKPWAQEPIDITPLLYIDDEEADAPPARAAQNYISPNGDRGEFEKWRVVNVLSQKQDGYNIVQVQIPLGDIYEHQFPLLANIARRYGGGRARFTQQQNMAFRWVRDEALYQVWKELGGAGFAEGDTNTITDVTACPATDSCKMGITSSMGLTRAVTDELLDMGVSDPMVKGLHIKISGCPNSCGQHHLANIGFQGGSMKGDKGNQVPAYEVFVGGSYPDMNGQNETRVGLRPRGKVPAKMAPQFTRRLLEYYQEQRQGDENFNGFVDRMGREPFEAIMKEFGEIGPLDRDNIATYMDWDKTVLYKLERGEGECAV